MEKTDYLPDLYKRAMKAADMAAKNVGGHESSVAETRCIDALRKLQNWPVDLKILVKTQAAKNLRRLTKHPRKKIQAVAVDLIAIWKNKCLDNKANSSSDKKPRRCSPIVLSRKKVEQGSSLSPKPANLVIKLGSSRVVLKRKELVEAADHSPPPAKAAKYAEPSSQTPLSMLSCNNDQAREKVRSQIREALSKVSREADDESVQSLRPGPGCGLRRGRAVQEAGSAHAGRASHGQVPKHLVQPEGWSEPGLPSKGSSWGCGSSEEMASDKRKSEIEAIRVKALFKCGRGEELKATTDEFKCGRCGLRECTHRSMQPRSADEPMTTYVMCIRCNNTWKLG